MTLFRNWGRGLGALVAAFFFLAPPASAAAIDAIRAMAQRQALEWQGIVVDLSEVMPYYAAGGAPLWVENGRPNGRADDLLAAIYKSDRDGLSPSDYSRAALERFRRAVNDSDAAGFELAMSAAFMALARDLHSGRTSPAVTEPDIVIARKPADPKAWLAMAAKNGVAKALARLQPQHVQYVQLRQMLAGYRALAARGGWPAVANGPALKPGMRDPRVAQMRANLTARGYSGIGSAQPDLFDGNLKEAVAHFQTRHGSEADGIVGPATLKALNVTAQERVRQLIVNMERWRWLPADFGARHVFVNQAAFEMFFTDKGKVIDRRRVIVGKPYHKTPIFSHTMTYLDFNPTWTVTPSIAASEFLPKLRQNPGYLAANNYQLYSGWSDAAQTIDPYSVNWNAVSAKSFPYRIVQMPGEKNALGVVKFMFPNRFNIYLHDTPSRQLFAKTGRAFSHGCIRVHKPLQFAETLLRLDQSMPRAKIDAIVDSGQLTRVRLKTGVPVHLAYFTAWVDDDGTPFFYDDVYGRDALVARLLFGQV